jgi:predicted amidohydrolase
MSRIIKCAHIQASNAKDDGTPAEIKEAMIQKHIPLIEEAGDKGVQILFNPSATTAGKSQYLWQLEQPAQAVANGVFIGANNRIGLEKPWEFGKFYGSSYFVDPRGQLLVQGSEDKDEVVRDLRPDQYIGLTETVGKYR